MAAYVGRFTDCLRPLLYTVNVQITDINETRKTLTVTLDKSEVDGEYNAILGDFTKQVSLPGFRPGKAPAAMVAKRYGKELKDEFKQKVIGKAYRDGLEQSKLEVLSLVEVEEGTIEPGLSAAIKLTVDVRPEFALPDYTGLETEVQTTEPTGAEVDTVIEGLCAERADFKVAERRAAKGDYVRFGYTGTLDGKPLADLVADKAIYASAPQTWEEVEGASEGLLPGMSEAARRPEGGRQDTLVSDARRVPGGFRRRARAGRQGRQLRHRGAGSPRARAAADGRGFLQGQPSRRPCRAEDRRSATNLKMRKEYENRAAQRRQVTDALVAQANFPVPDSLIASERDGVLRQFIEENMRRGIPQEQSR